jgi:hypothetical protein
MRANKKNWKTKDSWKKNFEFFPYYWLYTCLYHKRLRDDDKKVLDKPLDIFFVLLLYPYRIYLKMISNQKCNQILRKMLPVFIWKMA